MAVRWVRSAVVRPHHCAFLPQLGAAHRLGYFDFGTSIQAFDGHAYVSVEAVRMCAELMGWAPAGGVNPLAARVAELEAEVATLTGERDGLRAQVEAVGVLKSAGFAAARKPGRPAGKQKAVA